MKSNFLKEVKQRRTRYYLTNETPISQSKIILLIKDLVANTPTAFNSQGSRVVILFGKSHLKLWEIIRSVLYQKNGVKNFSNTDKKIAEFANAYGTILFFEDQSIIKNLQNTLPTYKKNFPIWASQSNGMLQYAIWTALAVEGLGASLQHYNPLIDLQVKKYFDILEDWELIAQMPFGKPIKDPDTKTFVDIGTRIKVFN